MRTVTTEGAFQRWLKRAKAGEAVIYHEGLLVVDRQRVLHRFGAETDAPLDIVEARADIDDLARAAWQAHRAGLVALTQVKFKPHVYQYVATRSQKLS